MRVTVRSTAPPARTTPPPTRALVPAAEFPSGLRLHGPAVPPAVSPAVSPATPPAAAWAHRLPGGSGAGSGISPVRRVLTHGNRRAGQPPVPAPHGTAHPTAHATRPRGTVPSRARCPAALPVLRPGLPHAGGYGTVVCGPHAEGTGVQGSPGTASVARCSPREYRVPLSCSSTATSLSPSPSAHRHWHSSAGYLQGTPLLPTSPGHPRVLPCPASTSYCTSTPPCPPTFPGHSIATPSSQRTPELRLTTRAPHCLPLSPHCTPPPASIPLPPRSPGCSLRPLNTPYILWVPPCSLPSRILLRCPVPAPLTSLSPFTRAPQHGPLCTPVRPVHSPRLPPPYILLVRPAGPGPVPR